MLEFDTVYNQDGTENTDITDTSEWERYEFPASYAPSDNEILSWATTNGFVFTIEDITEEDDPETRIAIAYRKAAQYRYDTPRVDTDI